MCYTTSSASLHRYVCVGLSVVQSTRPQGMSGLLGQGVCMYFESLCFDSNVLISGVSACARPLAFRAASQGGFSGIIDLTCFPTTLHVVQHALTALLHSLIAHIRPRFLDDDRG
jgi:hypothetical protein